MSLLTLSRGTLSGQIKRVQLSANLKNYQRNKMGSRRRVFYCPQAFLSDIRNSFYDQKEWQS